MGPSKKLNSEVRVVPHEARDVLIKFPNKNSHYRSLHICTQPRCERLYYSLYHPQKLDFFNFRIFGRRQPTPIGGGKSLRCGRVHASMATPFFWRRQTGVDYFARCGRFHSSLATRVRRRQNFLELRFWRRLQSSSVWPRSVHAKLASTADDSGLAGA